MSEWCLKLWEILDIMITRYKAKKFQPTTANFQDNDYVRCFTWFGTICAILKTWKTPMEQNMKYFNLLLHFRVILLYFREVVLFVVKNWRLRRFWFVNTYRKWFGCSWSCLQLTVLFRATLNEKQMNFLKSLWKIK